MNWDDVRVFLAAEREGTIAGASKALGVSRSTVNRRLDALESAAGVTLFERGPEGLTPTDAGFQLLPVARRMEEEAHAATRVFAGRDVSISGRLDVTLFDAAGDVFAPVFAELAFSYPEVELHCTISNRPFSLRRREADLAIRGTNRPSEELFGVQLGRMEYAVYGTAAVVSGRNPPWILWDEALGATGTEEVARKMGDPLRVVARVDSQYQMNELVCAGAGLGLLPVSIGGRRPELLPVGPVPYPLMGLDVWALTHPDLRRAAKVRAVMRFLADRASAVLNGPGA